MPSTSAVPLFLNELHARRKPTPHFWLGFAVPSWFGSCSAWGWVYVLNRDRDRDRDRKGEDKDKEKDKEKDKDN